MTALVRAISIGCAVPRGDFEATVHSVFDRAVNLQPTGERLLVTLQAFEGADLPQGIRLDTCWGLTFEGLPIGARVIFRGGVLRLGRVPSVDLRNARCWECDLSLVGADGWGANADAAWRCAWKALEQRRLHSGLEMITGRGREAAATYLPAAVDQCMDMAMRSTLRATRKYDLAGMAGLGSLVGLGVGLTPSGDDLLTGYLAGLWCSTRGKAERRGFLETVGELVIRCSSRTNDISRTYLCLAAKGQVSNRLADLAAAICQGTDAGRVRASAEAAMRVGHTSGMEAVNGLLLGLAAWDGLPLLQWAEAMALHENASHMTTLTPDPNHPAVGVRSMPDGATC